MLEDEPQRSSTPIPSPVSDLPVQKRRGFEAFWVTKATGLNFRATQQDPESPSPPHCAFVCKAAREHTQRVLYVSRAFTIAIDYRGNRSERIPGCWFCWGERTGGLRLIRADNYFPRMKVFNKEIWGILLHFGCFHCYCFSLSPKPVCVQVKTPDTGEDTVL